MLPRHRRRQYLIGNEPKRPALLVRVGLALLILLIVWYAASRVFAMFDHSIGRRATVLLQARSSDGVEVSLQDSDWQPAESGLKLNPGEAVRTRSAGDAIVQFFDGTKIRLAPSTELAIVDSDKRENGTSKVTVLVRSGRIWVASPTQDVYSGAIIRTVQTDNFDAQIPYGTQAGIDDLLMAVVRAGDIGLKTSLTFMSGNPVIYVGEGQYFSLSGDNKSAIQAGKDPYLFRDPLTAQLLKDDFLVSSYQLVTADAPAQAPAQTGSGASAPADTPDQPLTVTSPIDNVIANTKTVTVKGRISALVAQLIVNGQPITAARDGSFSADVSLSKDPTTLITVEAQDAQGIPLAKEERTVKNGYKPVVEPLRIKSPVGSGETLNTSQSEIEITGEAPPNTAGILINDYRLQLFKPNGQTWSYLASAALGNLQVGTNVFTAIALDADGNRSPSRSITINYLPGGTTSSGSGTAASTQPEPPIKQNPPLTPGVLGVDSPQAGTSLQTGDSEFSILGHTSADTYSISVNGYTLSLYEPYKTSWKYIASTNLGTMKRGHNVYRIVARNSGGEILDILEYAVDYQP